MNIQQLHSRLTFSFADMNSDNRLRELILYIAEKCESDRRFGATKLNKILAFADFYSFFRHGRPVTGAEYMRLPNGPAPRRMKWLLTQMENDGEIVIQQIEDGKFVQQRVIPRRSANRDLFTGREIEIVDEMIRAFWGATAKRLSAFSHGIAWRVADDKGLIPYEAVFLSDDPIDEYDIVRTRELNRRFKWESVA